MIFSSPVIAELAHYLHSRREEIILQWSKSVEEDDKVKSASHLSRREFKDHIPQVLQAFEVNLRALTADSANEDSPDTTAVEDAAEKHGAHRWQQGYSLEEMAREWEHLNIVVLDEIEAFAAKENMVAAANWPLVRRIWAQTAGEGVSTSAARFDELGRHEAESRVHDLEATLDKVRLIERERGEVMRQASHDMRGSLTVVQGAASLLNWKQLESLEPGQRDELIKMFNAGISALTEMMSDLLDLSRLEAGREKRNVTDFDAGAMLQELGRNAKTFAEEKKLALKLQGPAPFLVQSDSNKVRRIAQNLLLNAIKYTGQGEVSLTWRSLQENDADHWELIVADTGPGLKESAGAGIAQELDGVTKEARSIGASIPSPAALAPDGTKPDSPKNSRIVSGEGVGLSIVKRLCEILDATLELETGPTGSTFRVVFPLSY